MAGDGALPVYHIGHAAPPQVDAADNVVERVVFIYAHHNELYTIALYGLDGRLMQGLDAAPESLDSGFSCRIYIRPSHKRPSRPTPSPAFPL